MPSKSITGSLDLSQSSQNFVLNTASFLGYSIDMIISAGSDATGTIDVFCQNDDPSTSVATFSRKIRYAITSGKFKNNLTGQTIDSAYLTSAQFCKLLWTRTSGSGTLSIIGIAKSFT